MKRQKTVEHVKAELAARLGIDEVDPDVWNYLSRPSVAWVQAAMDCEVDAIDDLVDEYKAVPRAKGSPPPGARRAVPVRLDVGKEPKAHRGRADAFQERGQALARMLADQAAAEPDVIAFRSDVIGGRLLRLEQVGPWVREQAKKDGAPTTWAEVPWPVDPGDKRVPRLLLRSLHYVSADGAESAFTAEGGVLERLRREAELLSGTYGYGWREHEAATWLLTGIAPAVVSAACTWRHNTAHAPASRFTLELDPMIPPRVVAAMYTRARRRIGITGRTRTMSTKHHALAMFAWDGYRDDEPWPAILESWNKANPKWKYSTVGNLKRDAERAFERLLQPVYGHANTDGGNDHE